MKGLITVLFVLVILGLAFFLYSSPSVPPEMTEAEIAQMEAEVTALGDQWLADLGNLDVDSHAASLDPSSMHGNDGASYFPTFDEWVEHVRNLFSNFETVDVEWTNTRADVLGWDAALFVGQNDATVTRPDGSRSRMQGAIALTVRRIDGVWKIVHQSSVGRWTPIDEG